MARHPRGSAETPPRDRARAPAKSQATAEQTADIEQIIKRLDAGIAEERKAMDALLSRLRTSRIAA